MFTPNQHRLGHRSDGDSRQRGRYSPRLSDRCAQLIAAAASAALTSSGWGQHASAREPSRQRINPDRRL